MVSHQEVNDNLHAFFGIIIGVELLVLAISYGLKFYFHKLQEGDQKRARKVPRVKSASKSLKN